MNIIGVDMEMEETLHPFCRGRFHRPHAWAAKWVQKTYIAWQHRDLRRLGVGLWRKGRSFFPSCSVY